MDNLPFEILDKIFENIKNTTDILNIRIVCKKFYQCYSNKIPFYKNNNLIGNIFLENNIYWKSLEDKLIKEIIFKKYGLIKINIKNHNIFDTVVEYNLPNNINKRQYKHHLINHTDIDLKKNLIKTHTKNILVGYDGIPYCVIS
jgi:hypothetical protein